MLDNKLMSDSLSILVVCYTCFAKCAYANIAGGYFCPILSNSHSHVFCEVHVHHSSPFQMISVRLIINHSAIILITQCMQLKHCKNNKIQTRLPMDFFWWCNDQ